MKTIYIRISKKGEVKIEAEGFTGSACELATAPFERALGVVTDKEEKPERYQSENTQSLGL